MNAKEKKQLNDRMLLLMKWAIDTGIAENQRDYFSKIKFSNTNMYNVFKAGTQGFNIKHIDMAAKVTGANINWIFGHEPNMLRIDKERKQPAIIRLKALVAELEPHLR